MDRQPALDRLRWGGSALLSSLLLLASCISSDPPPPWGTHQMVPDLNADFREFAGATTDFDRTEVLAWRLDSSERRDRLEIGWI